MVEQTNETQSEHLLNENEIHTKTKSPAHFLWPRTPVPGRLLIEVTTKCETNYCFGVFVSYRSVSPQMCI